MTGLSDGTVVAHTAVRMTLALNQSLSQAIARFEELVPAVDIDVFRRSRSWDETIQLANINAPLGLMRFWKLDYAAVLAGSGTPARSFGYLMGNQTIAEQMIRHEPEVVLYAPLRTAIYAQTAARSSSSTNPAHYSAASATPTSPKSVVIWTHWSPLCSTPWALSCPPSCSRRADGKETDRYGNNQKKR